MARAVPLGVLGGEVNVRVGDDLVQQGLELCDDLVDDFLRLGVLFDLAVADELAVDLAVGADGQLAEVVQLRARGERTTSLPSLLLTISCGMVLWEWPSSTASRPVVLAMTSVERHGSEDSSIPRCATATT